MNLLGLFYWDVKYAKVQISSYFIGNNSCYFGTNSLVLNNRNRHKSILTPYNVLNRRKKLLFKAVCMFLWPTSHQFVHVIEEFASCLLGTNCSQTYLWIMGNLKIADMPTKF